MVLTYEDVEGHYWRKDEKRQFLLKVSFNGSFKISVGG